jgi:1-deoxyxylulose-5-phosphate synthase
MIKRILGRTHLQVSELCLSTTNFGWANDEATALALLDAYYTSGGRFIQSLGFCPTSTKSKPDDNRSEEFVGRWHQSRGIPRDDVVIATWLNLFRPVTGGSISFTNLIRECCESSLRRLRMTHLDLLICEWDETLLPIDDVSEAINMLIRAGLVRYAVAGAFPPWRLVDSLNRSSIRGHSRFEALQSDYSLMTRARFEAEALALCREHRLGFIARSPLAGGFLTKQATAPSEFARTNGEWLNERFGSHYGDTVMSAVSAIAEKRLASPAQIAMAWVLRSPQVTSALMSVTSVRDLRELMSAADIRLTDDETGTLANVTTMQDYRMELRHA